MADPDIDLSRLNPAALLRLSGAALDELRRREIVTTANAPLGDYAEWLFRRAYGWQPAGNSAKAFDATDASGQRIQIKARRLTGGPGDRQLGALRNLDNDRFDVLAAVLFRSDFRVARAALVPIATVRTQASFSPHTNAWRVFLRDSIWNMPAVTDATACLQHCET